MTPPATAKARRPKARKRPLTPLERAALLLAPAHAGHARTTDAGYLDLLDETGPPSTGPVQSLMVRGAFPALYERMRPFSRLLKGGLPGPSMSDEHRIAAEMLDLRPGQVILDVACGPGNFTRDFAAAVGKEGLAVGIDSSGAMLEHAVRETPAGSAAYVRGDAVELPFEDDSFDAVSCWAALYLIAEPFLALDHIARVLRPGGRVAILTSHETRLPVLRTVERAGARLGGVRLFGRDEVTLGLTERGFEDVTQRVSGFAQFVGARLGG